MTFTYPKHISRAELLRSTTAEKLGIDNEPHSEEVESNLVKLAHSLQVVRDICTAYKGEDTPLIITSGYRCSELNKAIGGVANSSHLSGLAADFVVTGLSVDQVMQVLYDHAPHLRFHKVINEFGRWIHMTAPYNKNKQSDREFLVALRKAGRVNYELYSR